MYQEFHHGCCGSPVNGGDFCNSTDQGVMTKEGTNLWSFTFESVKSYMGVGYKQAKDAAVAQGRDATRTQFGFLVKADNGCGGFQSANIEVPFTGPVYIKEEFETFPANAAQTDILTIKYNQDLETNAEMKSLTEVYLYATADLIGGGTLEPFDASEVGSSPSLKLIKNGTQHTISIIPRDFFEVPEGKQIERVSILIRSKDNADVNFGESKTIRIVQIK